MWRRGRPGQAGTAGSGNLAPRRPPAPAGPSSSTPFTAREGRLRCAMRRPLQPLLPAPGGGQVSRRARHPGVPRGESHAGRRRSRGRGGAGARGVTEPSAAQQGAPAASDLPPASPFMARSGGAGRGPPRVCEVLGLCARLGRRPPRGGSGRRGPPGSGGRPRSLGNGGRGGGGDGHRAGRLRAGEGAGEGETAPAAPRRLNKN